MYGIAFVGFLALLHINRAYLRPSMAGYDLVIALFSLCFCVTVYSLVRAVFVRPKNMVEVDDNGVYLHYSKRTTVYLSFKSIESVYAKRDSARGIKYSFGSLHLKTKDRRYKIGVLKNVSEVEEYIRSKITYKPFG